MPAPLTRLASWWVSKSKALQDNWIVAQEAHLQAVHGPRIAERKALIAQAQQRLEATLAELQVKQRDADDLLRRVEDRKVELAQTHEELRQQIRLIEAKAKPDSVWVQAFSSGYARAWDTMLPLMMDGVQQSKGYLRQEALKAALATVEPAVTQRVTEQIEDIERLRTFEELASKRKEFVSKRDASTGSDQARYDHYLEALTWMLNGHTA